ncbi:GNAT family N-acetyltransferase [Chitinimonas naiadis]
MNTPVLIREMCLDDAVAVAEILPELGYPSTVDEVVLRFERLGAVPDNLIFVAEVEGWVVGLCQVQGVRLIASNGYAEIFALVVAGGFQRRGIGRLLVDKAHEWALATGYQRLRLGSGAHREEAHRFYESLGFSKSRPGYVFERPLLGGIEPPTVT